MQLLRELHYVLFIITIFSFISYFQVLSWVKRLHSINILVGFNVFKYINADLKQYFKY